MIRNLTISSKQVQLNCIAFILISHAAVVFDHFFWIDFGISMLRYLVFLFLTIRFLQKPYVSIFEILWMLFGVILSVCTIIGEGPIVNVIGPAIDIAVLLLLFHQYQEDLTYLLKAITLALSFYIYINLILLFMYPEGLWVDPLSENGYYLLSGNYNGMGARFLCALVTNMLIYRTSRIAKINFYCLIVVSLVSVIFVKSMTSTVSLLMLMVLWLLAGHKKHKYLVIAFFIFYILAQIFIVFTLSDLSNYAYIAGFIENVLHKNTTFTSRTFLWENSAALISESPWLGYGYQTKVWNEIHLDGPGAHNFVYTILLYGGYPLLTSIILIILIALRQNTSLTHQHSLSRLLLGVNTLFFMMIFDYYAFFLIAYLLILIYYYPSFAQENE